MNDFTDLVDLASGRLGGRPIAANDEFFAPRENLVKPGGPVFREGEYTDRGKWMDGWETRRRREPGHDWCVIRLGLPGIVRGVVVDTTHFVGNHPESCAIEACAVEETRDEEEPALETASWSEILPRTPLAGNTENRFVISGDRRATHVRLNIFPDGGVARLRVYGVVVPDWERLGRVRGDVDLAAIENGGMVVAASDMFFGSRHNLILPGPARDMSDGWETRRRRGPGHDWAIVRLGATGRIHRAEIDTTHFKGNAPGACSLEVLHAPEAEAAQLTQPGRRWVALLPEVKLQPNTLHQFECELADAGEATHARLNIFPDGGVSRLRLFGRLSGPGM
jgi:allantoicase